MRWVKAIKNPCKSRGLQRNTYLQRGTTAQNVATATEILSVPLTHNILMRLNGEGPRVTIICALAGLTARGSEASAAAAVPAMERLRQLERGTTTWAGEILKKLCQLLRFSVSIANAYTPSGQPTAQSEQQASDSGGQTLQPTPSPPTPSNSHPFPIKPPPKPLPLLPLLPQYHAQTTTQPATTSGGCCSSTCLRYLPYELVTEDGNYSATIQ